MQVILLSEYLEEEMKMEELIQRQYELHGQIARAMENLKKLGRANITAGAIRSHLANLEKCFEEQHALLRSEHWEALKAHECVKKDYVGLTKESYLVNKGVLLDYAARLTKVTPTDVTPSQRETTRTTLPRIQSFRSSPASMTSGPPSEIFFNPSSGETSPLSRLRSSTILRPEG